jgi:hypothetical protein
MQERNEHDIYIYIYNRDYSELIQNTVVIPARDRYTVLTNIVSCSTISQGMLGRKITKTILIFIIFLTAYVSQYFYAYKFLEKHTVVPLSLSRNSVKLLWVLHPAVK